MQLEINSTEFLCIPVGDIPRMQLMTHYTQPWKAAQYRRMDKKVGCYKMVSVTRGHSPYFVTRCVIHYQRHIQLSPALCLPYLNPGRESTSSQQNICVSLQVARVFLGLPVKTLILTLSPTCLYKAGFRTNSCLSFASFTVMFSSII